MTHEKALERIIELETLLTESKSAYDSLNILNGELEETIKSKEKEVESLRESNMNFFLKLSQQEQNNNDNVEVGAETPTQRETKSWDDFLSEL